MHPDKYTRTLNNSINRGKQTTRLQISVGKKACNNLGRSAKREQYHITMVCWIRSYGHSRDGFYEFSFYCACAVFRRETRTRHWPALCSKTDINTTFTAHMCSRGTSLLMALLLVTTASHFSISIPVICKMRFLWVLFTRLAIEDEIFTLFFMAEYE